MTNHISTGEERIAGQALLHGYVDEGQHTVVRYGKKFEQHTLVANKNTGWIGAIGRFAVGVIGTIGTAGVLLASEEFRKQTFETAIYGQAEKTVLVAEDEKIPKKSEIKNQKQARKQRYGYDLADGKSMRKFMQKKLDAGELRDVNGHQYWIDKQEAGHTKILFAPHGDLKETQCWDFCDKAKGEALTDEPFHRAIRTFAASWDENQEKLAVEAETLAKKIAGDSWEGKSVEDQKKATKRILNQLTLMTINYKNYSVTFNTEIDPNAGAPLLNIVTTGVTVAISDKMKEEWNRIHNTSTMEHKDQVQGRYLPPKSDKKDDTAPPVPRPAASSSSTPPAIASAVESSESEEEEDDLETRTSIHTIATEKNTENN